MLFSPRGAAINRDAAVLPSVALIVAALKTLMPMSRNR
jgi:hypothetical protein